MTYTRADHIKHIVNSLETRLREAPASGRLDAETVLALDIVTHALEFTHSRDGLFLWREALWGHTLREDARLAVVKMLQHVLEAAERGDADAITDICDCLQQVVGHEVFGRSSNHIGGIRHSTQALPA